MLLLALPGSAYIYQGDELGLPEVTDIPAQARQDPTFYRTQGQVPGRDGCRVPIPWARTGRGYGFSAGLYLAALRLRREHPALGRAR